MPKAVVSTPTMNAKDIESLLKKAKKRMENSDKDSKKYKNAKQMLKNLRAAQALMNSKNVKESSSDSSEDTSSDDDEEDDDDVEEEPATPQKRKKENANEDEDVRPDEEEPSTSKKATPRKTGKNSKQYEEGETAPKKRKPDSKAPEQVEVVKKGDCITKNYAPTTD
ncbi:unnamed protein product [Orchesella dallaii]|uniref:Uncharacterized protein n=1 Tax=Orchesella dallaii TaxID=48710 RepID=A0ABP1Q030_9HEXA